MPSQRRDAASASNPPDRGGTARWGAGDPPRCANPQGAGGRVKGCGRNPGRRGRGGRDGAAPDGRPKGQTGGAKGQAEQSGPAQRAVRAGRARQGRARSAFCRMRGANMGLKGAGGTIPVYSMRIGICSRLQAKMASIY